MAREVRIALILGGGVSLGSFSGGALAEALRLLDRFPARRRDGRGRETPLAPRIDVVSGASAGAMTLAIVLRLLLCGRSPAAVARALRDAWVKGVGIDYGERSERQLLPPDLDAHADPSLFSTAPIERLARRYLALGEGTRPRPSPLLAPTVYASFALANLHGIDLRAPAQLIRQASAGAPGTARGSGDDALITTFHDDRMRFRIEAAGRPRRGIRIDPRSRAVRVRGLGSPDDPRDPWSLLRAAAIASGSFPAAFPPVAIPRREAEYGRLWPEDLADEELSAFRFAYVDGGTFRNEPLREAIELARLRDEGADPARFERVFLLVDPNISGSSAVRALDFESPLSLATRYGEDGVTVEAHELERRDYAGLLLGVLGRVAAMVQGQATFRDWLRVAKWNSRVEWEAGLRAILVELAGRDRSAARLRAARELLDAIYRDKVARGPGREGGGAALAEAARRRDADLAALRRELGPGPGELALVLILALRNAAGLRRKRRLDMVAVSPWSVPDPPLPLAGNFLANFGGFFDESWRAFDYDAGRFAAHFVLTREVTPDVEALIRPRAPRPVPRPRPDADPRFQKVAPEVRERFLEGVRDHVERLAHAAGLPEVVDDAVSRLLQPRIESALGTPAVTARTILVRITGPIEEGHELKAGPTGARGEPVEREDGALVLETLVEAREEADRPAASRHALLGPHLVRSEGAAPEIRMVWDAWLSRERHELTLRLAGPAERWFRTARRRRLLEVAWEPGTRRVTARPEELAPLA